MKRMKKGFTLVELLVTIVLLGIVGGIIIYNMTSVSSNSKDTEYERFVAKVKSAAAVYADLNPSAFDDLYVSKSYLYITVNDLVGQGLLDENLENPYTEQKIGLDELIKANLDSTSGALTFTYPLNDKNQETFMVAISDYVVYGEPYNCMTGAGTYRLALSDEDGNLIQLADEDGNLDGDVISKYNVQCKFDSDGEFKTYSQAGTKDAYNSAGEKVASFDYKSSTKPGTYDITYTWYTESGTKKETTRQLTVNAELVPEIEFFHSENNTSFDPSNDNIFKPTLKNSETCTSNWSDWDYLIFKPSISGADQATTTYSITAGLKNTDTSVTTFKKIDDTVVTLNNVQDYSTYYKAYDGTYYYTINTTVQGHYYKDYSYTSKNVIKATQDLVLYPCQVTTTYSSDWATSKSYTVNETYHVGDSIYYEYLLGEDTVPNNGTPGTSTNNGDGTYNVTASALKDTGVSTNSFTNLYVRAVNQDGYKGTTWAKVTGNITNNLYNLLSNDSNCIPVTDLDSTLQTYINNSKSLSGLKCVFRDKTARVKYGKQTYNVLGLYKTANNLLLATDGGLFDRKINLVEIYYHKWWIQTCDGLFSSSFVASSPAMDNLEKILGEYDADVLKDIDNYGVVVVQESPWNAVINDVDYTKMPNTAAYFSDTSSYYTRYSQWQYDADASSYWAAWKKAYDSSDYPYNSTVGAPVKNDYYLFGKALSGETIDGANNTYWLAETFPGVEKKTKISHGDTLPYKDVNFLAMTSDGVSSEYVASTSRATKIVEYKQVCYYIKVNGKNGCENLPYKYEYVGATAYVKGMLRIKPSSVIDASNGLYTISTNN